MKKKKVEQPQSEPGETTPEPYAEVKQRLRDEAGRLIENFQYFAKPTFSNQLPDVSEFESSESVLNNSVQPSHTPNPYPPKPPIRNTASETPAELGPPETPPASPPKQPQREISDFVSKLNRKAKAGDTKALQRLGEGLDRHPEAWQRLGDLSLLAETEFIQHIAAESPMLAESLRREIPRLKAELLSANPTPLEQITVQRVVATWLHAQYIDRACMSADAEGGIASYWSKRQVMADKRYMMAIKALELAHKVQAAVQSRQKQEAAATKPTKRGKQTRRAAGA